MNDLSRIEKQIMEWKAYIEPNKEIIKRISGLTNSSTEDEWKDVLEEISLFRQYVCNYKESSESPFPDKRWTLQHHAAFHRAPKNIVEAMKKKHFALSFTDSNGKLPKDHVPAEAEDQYRDLFTPKYDMAHLDFQKLAKIEKNFHEVILSRAEKLVKEHNLVLPLLTVILEQRELSGEEKVWCAIPGMYGGFSIELFLNEEGSNVEHLETRSWCRVVGGSGQSHKCTADKWELIDEGFV